MKCSDRFCSCKSLETKLMEPHSQFCVEASSANATANRKAAALADASSAGSGLTTMLVIICLISVVILVLVTLMLLQVCQGLCDRGQYVCDEAKAAGGEQRPPAREETTDSHVAAWDLPGLDYLSEEQTMKYLNRGQPSPPVNTSTPNQGQPLRRIGGTQHIDQAGSSSGSSPSPSGTSLPESDRFEGAHDVVNRRADGGCNGAVGGGGSKLMASKTNSVETVQSHIL